MADVNKSIKTSGGDYTSASLFEAALPAAGSDRWIGTYEEAFTDTTAVTFTGIGGSVSVVLTVAEAFKCKGAVSGSHAALSVTGAGASRTISNQHPLLTVTHLRIVRDGAGGGSYAIVDGATSGTPIYESCTIIRRNGGATGGEAIVTNAAGGAIFRNCFIVASGCNAAGVSVCNFAAGTPAIMNNTFFLADGTVASSVLSSGTAVTDARNNLCLEAAGATSAACYSGAGARWSGDSTKNAASDTTGTTPSGDGYNSKAVTSILTQTVGSENLHFVSSAEMIACGSGSNLSSLFSTDIDGEVRSGWYTGADWLPTAPDGGGRGLRLGMRLGL